MPAMKFFERLSLLKIFLILYRNQITGYFVGQADFIDSVPQGESAFGRIANVQDGHIAGFISHSAFCKIIFLFMTDLTKAVYDGPTTTEQQAEWLEDVSGVSFSGKFSRGIFLINFLSWTDTFDAFSQTDSSTRNISGNT